MSGKTLFEEGLQRGEITPTFDQLKQQISELQKAPVIFESLRLSEQVVEIGGTTHRDNPFTP